MNKKILILLTLFALLLSACNANIQRNDDGSVTVETTIGQQELQDVISSSIADPLVQDITVSLQNGYILVNGTRQRLNDSSKTDTMSFRLDLGVSNGNLTASISNAQIDNYAIDQARISNWNQTIANRLSNFGGRNENAVLQSVSVTTSAVTMVWNVAR
jgi:PBP1b-binding outer membrane lipoprotein LpoB